MNNMRKKLICIVGGSGVGKNELAKTINATYGIKSIVSYTTRPKREGEVNHVDYHFVDKCPSDHSSFLEYNNFNGFDYWSTLEDLNDDAYTFIS